MDNTRQEYVLGFLFDEERKKVALIKKNRPDWQAGFYNGIGGKVEAGEAAFDAMIREFEEEAGLHVPTWNRLCRMMSKDWYVYVYWGIGDLTSLKSLTDEPVSIWEIYEINELNVVSNLRWLIPMALDEGQQFHEPLIKYK